MHRVWVSRMLFCSAFLLAGLGFGSYGLTSNVAAQSSPAGPAPASIEFYNANVKPIFAANCFRCHGGLNRRGGLQMDTKAGMARGGRSGNAVVPGQPEQSLLVKLIRHEGPANDPMDMPQSRAKLSDSDIATVEQWVRAGALMPEDTPKP